MRTGLYDSQAIPNLGGRRETRVAESLRSKPDGSLGSGPIHMIEMAFDMASHTRKSPKSGVYSPVKGFDAVGRQPIERPSDRVCLYGLLCRNPLKVERLPAGLLLASAQTRHDHCNQMNRSCPQC